LKFHFFTARYDFKVQKYPRKSESAAVFGALKKINILLVSAVRCMPPAGWSLTQMRGVVSD
jgi:hypothetical protein